MKEKSSPPCFIYPIKLNATLSEAAALIHHFTQDEFPPYAGAVHICFPVFGRTRRGHLAQIRSCIIQREPIFATRAPTSSDISSSLLPQRGTGGIGLKIINKMGTKPANCGDKRLRRTERRR